MVNETIAVNWKPENNAIVHWHMPGGEVLEITTTFTDTNPPIINTIEGFAARYANGKIPERDGVRAHLWGQADDNPILSAAMERAGKDKSNKWKLSESDFNNPVTVQDFGATQIGSEGLAKSEIIKLYPPPGEVGGFAARPGDSTDPKNRTERKILAPYGPYDRIGMDGKTYYYFNPRKNRPGDPWFEKEEEVRKATETHEPTVAGIISRNTIEELKLSANKVRNALPMQGKGGAPLQTLANNIRPLLDLIDKI